MFGRIMKRAGRILPLAALFAHSIAFTTPRLDSSLPPDTPLLQSPQHATLPISPHRKIKIIKNLQEYIESDPEAGMCVILYELKGDAFLDQQVIDMAEEFISSHSNDLSHDYQFLFLRNDSQQPPEEDTYMVIYGVAGEKVIDISPYINSKSAFPNLRTNRKALMNRLVEAVNLYREVGLQNIHDELKCMASTDHYAALVAIGSDNTQSSRIQLKKFLKNNEVINKRTRKFVIRDQQSRIVLGLGDRKDGVYLLVAESPNMKESFMQSVNFISIGGRNFAVFDAESPSLKDIFTFPPVGPKVGSSESVLNCYVNRNANTADLEAALYQQMSKDAYRDYQRSLFYSSDVKQAEIVVEKQDYTQMALEAYQKPPKISQIQAKELLKNSYQFRYPLSSEHPLDSKEVQSWVQDSITGRNPSQQYKSEGVASIYAQQLTGQEYKDVVESNRDKVIYHYSQHCHGCKRFGGKYELFARDANLMPGLDFYRIDNDRNKAAGVRNYNSTPVFAFYKKGYPQFPFLYRMDIWTESLFRMFLDITKEVTVVEPGVLERCVQQKVGAGDVWSEVKQSS